MRVLSGSRPLHGAPGLLLLTVNLQLFVPSQTPIVAFYVKKQFKNGPYLI